jgi:AraC-like DNA-binding protein
VSSFPDPLFAFLAEKPCEPVEITPLVDSRRHLSRRFDPALPLLLKQYAFPNYRRMIGPQWMHWHEYFEMIIPVSGTGQFQVGDQTAAFAPGDLLVVDNLKLHGVSKLSGPHRSLVIFFPLELITPAGNTAPDHAFLAPLCGRPEDTPPVLRSNAPQAPAIRRALLRIAEVWFSTGPTLDRYVDAKIQILTILALLREHFGLRQDFHEELQRRHQRQSRLQNVFAWIATNFADPITQPQAAAIAGMSASRFREFFKQTTGGTFVDFVRDFRLSRAAQMLRESDDSVASIAAATGFSDQSYLHRCFKQRHGAAPLEYRKRHLAEIVSE